MYGTITQQPRNQRNIEQANVNKRPLGAREEMMRQPVDLKKCNNKLALSFAQVWPSAHVIATPPPPNPFQKYNKNS